MLLVHCVWLQVFRQVKTGNPKTIRKQAQWMPLFPSVAKMAGCNSTSCNSDIQAYLGVGVCVCVCVCVSAWGRLEHRPPSWRSKTKGRKCQKLSANFKFSASISSPPSLLGNDFLFSLWGTKPNDLRPRICNSSSKYATQEKTLFNDLQQGFAIGTGIFCRNMNYKGAKRRIISSQIIFI